MAKTKKRARKIKAEVPETFKIKPEEVKEVIAPKPEVKKEIKPEVGLEPVEQGLKRPSITDLKEAHTYKSFEKLIEAYKISNPRKYEMKKVALATKLAKLK